MDEEIRFVGDLQRLEVRHGDKFVLKVPRPMSEQQVARLRQNLTRFIGDGVDVLILSDGMELGVVGSAE